MLRAYTYIFIILRSICEILEEKCNKNNNYEKETITFIVRTADNDWRAECKGDRLL